MERLTDSKAAIRAAEEVGARQVPAASIHLQLAQDQARIAEGLIQEKRYEQADLFLQRARADADIAMAFSREAPLRAELQRALTRVHAFETQTPAKPDEGRQ